MPAHVHSAFVYLGDRRVYYRWAGQGPAIVLLHQSPRTSAEHADWMRTLGDRYLVIAPDTPGYGFSDALPEQFGATWIDHYVDALADLLDALGLDRPTLYGSHSGAIIAVRFAGRYPNRISALVANGIMLSDVAERADLAAYYLDPIRPRWDGAHLAEIWSRLRDQLVFYPWYRRTPAARIDWAQPLAETDASALDMLRAGDRYRGAYGAVLGYDIRPDLERLACDTLLIVAKPDILARYVDHYPTMPGRVTVELADDFASVPAAIDRFVARRPGPVIHFAPPASARRRGPSSAVVPLAEGDIHIRAIGPPQAMSAMALHDIGASAASLDALIGAAGTDVRLVAPDLPGHGASDARPDRTAAGAASALLALADALGWQRFRIVAIGASAAIVGAMLVAAPDRIIRAALIEPPEPGANAALPDLSPDSAGSHLTRAWMYLRDRALFSPWDRRSAVTATGVCS